MHNNLRDMVPNPAGPRGVRRGKTGRPLLREVAPRRHHRGWALGRVAWARPWADFQIGLAKAICEEGRRALTAA
jgi:hypothetical protein